jgi:hypothetical protein
MMVAIGALGGAGIGYLASNAVAESSAGSGTGNVTVTVTSSTHQVTTSSTPIALKP